MTHFFRRLQPIPCALLACLMTHGSAQQSPPPPMLSSSGEDTVVTVQGARPLSLALTAISEQFGWGVDYEDPVYSPAETGDAAVPEWKSQHPGEQGLLVPSGEKFVGNLGKIDMNKPDERRTLDNLIRVYNQSLNSGYFRLIETPFHRWVVSGWSRTVKTPTGILDGMMQPGPDRQVASEALQKLAMQCGSSGGVPIELGLIPNNALSQQAVDGYNEDLSCRDQLGRIIKAISPSMIYDLFYDIGSKSYYLSIVPTHRIVIGPDGKPTTIPLQKAVSH
jgi:hypothetical protein